LISSATGSTFSCLREQTTTFAVAGELLGGHLSDAARGSRDDD
jgi:hypothetical protein